MKRIGTNIILAVLFILLLTLIVLSFLADISLEKAKKLETDYRWRRAAEAYQQAVHLSPLNAKYFAEAGNFMLRQSEYCKGEDNLSSLKRAEKLYQRASQLNPRYAQYHYLLGKVRVELRETDLAIEDFKKAIERDPYNFRNNYLIGHSLLTIWNTLDNQEKNLALDRLRFVLQSRPWYGSFVYPAIIYCAEDFALAQRVTPQTLAGHKQLYSFIAENNLWQYRKVQKKLVNFYRQKEEPEEFRREELAGLERIENLKKAKTGVGDLVSSKDWQGTSEDGNAYKQGNMYWTGTVDAVVDIPEGKVKISIMAEGTPANEVFPYMIVELDGKEITETFVNNPEWKEYTFDLDTQGGLKVLSVTFANDGGNKDKNEDRNLYLGEARIIK